jgi:hypothetical protein
MGAKMTEHNHKHDRRIDTLFARLIEELAKLTVKLVDGKRQVSVTGVLDALTELKTEVKRS